MTLPIEAVLPALKQALSQRDEAVLEAPPGAGKTTLVPPALLDAPWLEGGRIILLEPRRLAARAAAERMAQLLGEQTGQTVGYRVRLDSRISGQTRIEVVTEGILTRMLQADPALEGVGLIIFDEFHERSLDADLGLALALQGRTLFREQLPLKLLVMSATLEGERLAALLNDAPIIRSEGRLHPVAIRYGDPFLPMEDLQAGLPARVCSVVARALAEESGSLLVFLPGQAEIRRVQEALESLPECGNDVRIAPLYGDLDLARQREAIEPAPPGRRKIVLATDIAETSLTIEGVRVVIDSGLHRQPRFDAGAGMSRLHTRRISRASSVQRAGRAGRTEAGVCYRLWSEDQQAQLIPVTPPAIEQADLLPLMLQLHCWGAADPAELDWLDPPPAGPCARARELLLALGALAPAGQGWKLTEHGEAMARLPLHPRLAHMLLMARARGLARPACRIAALLGERDPLNTPEADIQLRLQRLNGGGKGGRWQRLRRQAQAFLDLIGDDGGDFSADARSTGYLLACAYPERIARRRAPGEVIYRLANGRAASLQETDPLRRHEWLVVAGLGGRAGQATDRIFLAAECDPALFGEELAELVREQEVIRWDGREDALLAERQHRIGALVMAREPLREIPPGRGCEVLCEQIRRRGLELLSWNAELRNWQARVQLLRELEAGSDAWPDVSDTGLLASLEDWLGPFLDGLRSLKQLKALDLGRILRARLSWEQQQALDELAPERLRVPSGSRIRIDYRQRPPVLAVRLQEMFGCAETPRIAGGRIALQLHLLSPAQRPLQVTQDLGGFWQSSYRQVQKDMKGRYPKHHWPDDPLAATPSARTTRKG